MQTGWTFYTPYSTAPVFGLTPFDVLMLVLLGLVLVSLVGLAALWWRVLRTPGAIPPRCGGCGYPVRGLAAMQCPECGDSFFKVGIETTKRKMVGPLAFSLLWLLLYPLPTMAFVSLLLAVGPQVLHTEPNYELASRTGSHTVMLLPGTSDGLFLGGVGFSFVPLGDEVRSIGVDIDHPAAIKYESFSFDCDTGTITDWISPTPSPIDAQSVLAVFGSAGLNASDPAIVAEAEELRRILDGMTATGLVLPASTVFTVTDNSFSYDIPAPWFASLVFWVSVAGWLLGLVLYFLVRRRRAKQRHARHRGLAGGATAVSATTAE